MIGIYRIRNLINGKCYYGSSKNIDKRWIKHQSDLNNQTHHNIYLQRAWNKYGKAKFVFEIIEETTTSNLLETEQKYLDLCPKYNIGKAALGGDNITNNPNRANIIERMTISINERYNSLTNEERKKIYGKLNNKNPNWKGGVSKKKCKCGTKIKPINETCSNCRDVDGKNNPFYNKTHTNLVKKKLSEIRKSQGYVGNQNIPLIVDDVEYSSLGDASTKLDIPITTIRWRIKSNNKKFVNYKYKL